MLINLKKLFDEDIYDKDINPADGIGTKAFEAVSCLTPIVNIDILIRNKEGKTLVSWREDAVCGNGWHLPGGIIRYKETFIERVHKTAISEIGSDVYVDEKPLEINEILLPQDIRGHFISVLYSCKLKEDLVFEEKTSYQNGDLHWYEDGKDVQLVKGQRDIYTKYLKG